MNTNEAAVRMIQEGVCLTYSLRMPVYRWRCRRFCWYGNEGIWKVAVDLPDADNWREVRDPSLPFPEPEPKVVDVECRVQRGEWVYNDHDGLIALITNAPADTRFVKFAWDLPDGYVFTADQYAPLYRDSSDTMPMVYHEWGPGLELLIPHLHMRDRDPKIVGEGDDDE